jgi:hypothetical protein
MLTPWNREATSCSTSQEIPLPTFNGTQRFITMFTRAYQLQGPVEHFVTSCFLVVGVVSPSHNLKAEVLPTVGCPQLLIPYIFAADMACHSDRDLYNKVV